MKRLVMYSLILTFVLAGVRPTHAEDSIFYTSQPERVAIFLNDIAYASDTISLPGDAQVQVVLPDTIFQDTLLLYENDVRVPSYRVNRQDNKLVVQWQTNSEVDLVTARLDYLMAGLSWSPKYDMWIEGGDSVEFDFYVEIANRVLTLDEVEVMLIAGRVDTSQQINAVSTITTNQYIAGYDEGIVDIGTGGQTGRATIQHVYTLGTIEAEPGDLVYTRLSENTLPARRVLLWNANAENNVDVIYKITNESADPLAEGVVRTYENGLFLGSDFIELTPIGSEGSVTVGNLPDVRVNRSQTDTYIGGDSDEDQKSTVELTLSNYSQETVEIEVVDRYSSGANRFSFSEEPAREGGNLFRWVITLEPGQTIKINYEYRS